MASMVVARPVVAAGAAVRSAGAVGRPVEGAAVARRWRPRRRCGRPGRLGGRWRGRPLHARWRPRRRLHWPRLRCGWDRRPLRGLRSRLGWRLLPRFCRGLVGGGWRLLRLRCDDRRPRQRGHKGKARNDRAEQQQIFHRHGAFLRAHTGAPVVLRYEYVSAKSLAMIDWRPSPGLRPRQTSCRCGRVLQKQDTPVDGALTGRTRRPKNARLPGRCAI